MRMKLANSLAIGGQGGAASPPSPLLDGLVGYWTMDEASGVRADSVGAADLSDINTVGSVAGKQSNAANLLEGNQEQLESSGVLYDYSNGFTVSLWVNSPSATATVRHDAPVPGVNRAGWMLTGATFYVIQDATGPIYSSVSVVWPANQWAHLLLLWDPADGKTHAQINGGSYLAGTVIASVREFANPVSIGKWNGLWSTFKIDELALWTRVLTSDERAEMYNSGAGKFYPFS